MISPAYSPRLPPPEADTVCRQAKTLTKRASRQAFGGTDSQMCYFIYRSSQMMLEPFFKKNLKIFLIFSNPKLEFQSRVGLADKKERGGGKEFLSARHGFETLSRQRRDVFPTNPNSIFPKGGDFSCRGYCRDGGALLPISDDNTTAFGRYCQFLLLSNLQLIHDFRRNID